MVMTTDEREENRISRDLLFIWDSCRVVCADSIVNPMLKLCSSSALYKRKAQLLFGFSKIVNSDEVV